MASIALGLLLEGPPTLPQKKLARNTIVINIIAIIIDTTLCVDRWPRMERGPP
jgi:hypothetical protein